ncbi:glycosyl hydrolase family 28-related protein [Nesterenkonia haasae]|uniref:glycosyl hydrolase family 28-related protein n=1 Tax=Nesterenkonia haasae TaxID=2587813 RepID=UPI001390BA89|nr:glycosyl hydrolase family 28-related protein [Nesterenkonia haasae]NDK30741.1 DUF4955 domain-containing protein [Nesterenkonia haasae]
MTFGPLHQLRAHLQRLFHKQDTSLAAQLWRDYTAHPSKHPRIPNVSYAGYQMGNQPIPNRAGPLFRVEEFGAHPDTSSECDEAVAAAVHAAEEAGGGVVLFPEGIFYFSSVIWVHASNVVIRGAGQGKTTLYFTQPLEAAYRHSRMGEWSWTGGLVWFLPRELRHELETSDWAWGTNEGWTGNRELAKLTQPVVRGTRRIHLTDTMEILPGDEIILTLTNTPDNSLLSHLCGDLPPGSYDFAQLASSLHKQKNYRQLRWPVRVEAVEENSLILAQPTKVDLRLEWDPTVTSLGPHVRESGIEDCTIRMHPSAQQPHNQDHGFNGPHFQAALDCWARRVEVIDADNGFGFTSAKGITLHQVAVSGRARHHSFICREQSHDCLVHEFSIAAATTALAAQALTHGLNVEGYSSGNVWSEGEMEGTFDSHRRVPFENVRTCIRLTNTGSLGGAKKAGPHWGARFVHWNVEVTNKRAFAVRLEHHAPYSAMVGVTGPSKPHPKPSEFSGDLHSILADVGTTVSPRNLYLAQLKHRLESSAARTRKEQL